MTRQVGFLLHWQTMFSVYIVATYALRMNISMLFISVQKGQTSWTAIQEYPILRGKLCATRGGMFPVKFWRPSWWYLGDERCPADDMILRGLISSSIAVEHANWNAPFSQGQAWFQHVEDIRHDVLHDRAELLLREENRGILLEIYNSRAMEPATPLKSGSARTRKNLNQIVNLIYCTEWCSLSEGHLDHFFFVTAWQIPLVLLMNFNVCTSVICDRLSFSDKGRSSFTSLDYCAFPILADSADQTAGAYFSPKRTAASLSTLLHTVVGLWRCNSFLEFLLFDRGWLSSYRAGPAKNLGWSYRNVAMRGSWREQGLACYFVKVLRWRDKPLTEVSRGGRL